MYQSPVFYPRGDWGYHTLSQEEIFEKCITGLPYQTTIVINELLHPYVGTPDLFSITRIFDP